MLIKKIYKINSLNELYLFTHEILTFALELIPIVYDNQHLPATTLII